MANLEPYIELLAAMVEGNMEPTEFERRFLHAYKNDQTIRPEAEFQVLDKLFGDVDAFEPDAELRAQLDDTIDADELRRAATEALTRLRALTQSH